MMISVALRWPKLILFSSDTQFCCIGFVVQDRGAAIIEARKLSSAASAAQAVVDHMHDWLLGTAEGEWVSMAVPSDGSYGAPKGVVFSFPVTCKAGTYKIVQGLKLSEFDKEKIKITGAELLEEKAIALPAKKA